MKLKSILFLTVLLFGCQSGSQKQTNEGLPVIDLSKRYPKKEIILEDIADIEYVPLETADDVLLTSNSFLFHVSDKYIAFFDLRGDIFIFDRNGRIISHFNHTGQGDKEYIGIIGNAGVVFDEKNEELFVISQFRILVYNLSGEYKRTLKYTTGLSQYLQVYDFDDETLLAFDYGDIRQFLSGAANVYPYVILSKRDGSILDTIDIKLTARYSTRRAQEVEMKGGQKMWIPLEIGISYKKHFGYRDYIIPDISSDTIYRLNKEKGLTPMMVRTPSVHSSDPPTVWTSILTTDKFILLYTTVLDFIALEQGRTIPTATLMYEFESGDIKEVSFLSDDIKREWKPNSMMPLSIPINMDADFLWVPQIKRAFEQKRLKGELEKLEPMLDVEDNPVVRIIKFK